MIQAELAADIGYLATDFMWNAESEFRLNFHNQIIPENIVLGFNQHLQYRGYAGFVMASAQHTGYSLIVHCKPKRGSPTADMPQLRINGTELHISWPGVTRIFVRVRIMEATTLDDLTAILMDDIGSGHSVSDVDDPDRNQSFKPWSDEEDSYTDTVSNPGSSREGSEGS